MNIFQFLSQYMGILWNFFRLPFPATRIPIGAILFFPSIVSLSIAIFRNITGVGGFAQITEGIKMGSSTAKVDRQLTRNTENEARQFVK